MTTRLLIDLIHTKHDPSLAKQTGMVYQVWEDGEITLQKCGELLWQRNLHQMSGPVGKSLPPLQMPAQYGVHGYAFVTRDDAELIRDEIKQLTIS